MLRAPYNLNLDGEDATWMCFSDVDSVFICGYNNNIKDVVVVVVKFLF